MKEYYAHSKSNSGEKQLLSVHSVNVAELCKKFASDFGAGELGYWLGLWHDIGKTNPKFQERICKGDDTIRADHKLAGTIVCKKHFEPLALLAAGHHGGLKSPTDIENWIREKSKTDNPEAQIEKTQNLFDTFEPEPYPSPDSLSQNIPDFLKQKYPLELEFFLRMLFSCLVDADFLDTEEHFHPKKSTLREREDDISNLLDKFTIHQNKLPKTQSIVNTIREEVYQVCLASAEKPGGFFRLQVPTGGGKTLSSLGFALQHCRKHGLKRIIYAVPYTSIIEQTAGVFKNIFGENSVLEHHSVVEYKEDDEQDNKQMEKWKLIAENWDFPLIVTTTVQLFDSMFSNMTSRCRKLHNLAKSVIILDEVQTLPERLLEPILDEMKQLTTHYGTTVLLCTATQPAFDDNPYFKGISDVRDIITKPERMYENLKRVDYEFPALSEKWSWAKVSEEMTSSKQAMTIVNSKKDALALLGELEGRDGVFHLSTSLCGAHRKDVLEVVRKRLYEKEPCLLVSTQVVEAGVDIDFPLVLRAMGPLDRIVQAAGRCNREGKLNKGRVIIFHPEKEHPPKGAYKTGTDNAVSVLKKGMDIYDPATYRLYFERLYQTVETDRIIKFTDGTRTTIQKLRKSLNYPIVAKHFKLIDNITTPVIVEYKGLDGKSEKIHACLNDLRTEPSRKSMRRLQPYLIDLYPYQFSVAYRESLVEKLQSGLFFWTGSYDILRGIDFRNINPENLYH